MTTRPHSAGQWERPDLLELLPDFNERMVRFGAVLVPLPPAVRGGAEPLCRPPPSGVLRRKGAPGDHLSDCFLRHGPGGGGGGPLTGQLRAHMESHQGAGRPPGCLSGPHKDDLVITIDGREAKSYSSQGQTRTAALALKLAEREIYQNATGEYPVLLLDDVLSELDPRRQEFVLNRIAGGQVFITCCEDDRLPVAGRGRCSM